MASLTLCVCVNLRVFILFCVMLYACIANAHHNLVRFFSLFSFLFICQFDSKQNCTLVDKDNFFSYRLKLLYTLSYSSHTQKKTYVRTDILIPQNHSRECIIIFRIFCCFCGCLTAGFSSAYKMGIKDDAFKKNTHTLFLRW